MSNTNDEICNNFARILGIKNLTIREVSTRAGLPYETLTRVARGATRWRSDLIDAAAKGLGVKPVELLVPPTHPQTFDPKRDGPAALRSIAAHLEAQAAADAVSAPANPHLTALHQAIASEDIRAALAALSALGARWDDA